MREKLKAVATWFCDTEEEFNEHIQELEGNPDFTFFWGLWYDSGRGRWIFISRD